MSSKEMIDLQKKYEQDKLNNNQPVIKSAEKLEAEFNAHLSKEWMKREKLEKQRIRAERIEAVRKAEMDLLLSEEERNHHLLERKEKEAKHSEMARSNRGHLRA